MKEKWKDIPGYEGRYQISNKGRVKTLNYKRTGKAKILKHDKTWNGYHTIVLRIGGAGSKQIHPLISRLVASAFIPNPNGKDFVNHKDGNRDNNSVENLEWVSREENELHKIYVLGNPSGCCIPPCKIYCVETGEEYRSISYAAKCVGVCQARMSAAVSSGGKVKGKTYKKA